MLVQRFETGAASSPRLWIGDWFVDPATNELRRGSERVRIEPKAMEVLMLLAERPGRVVGRDELFAGVWPGVVVGDEALTQSVIKLRRALGDNPRAASYIETISKRGYRLIAAVRQDEGAGTPDRIEFAVPQRHPAQARRRIRPFAIAGGVLFALLVSAVLFFRSAPQWPFGADPSDLEDARQQSTLAVTVLPFVPLGAGGEQSYLAQGISNGLRTELSRLPGLRLIRASSTPNAESTPGARYLISGSVQRESDTLRIGIHLTDMAANQELWSERFERPFGDLFALQDEMTRKLAEMLPAKLTEAARRQLAKRYTRSLEAYDFFLRGQALFLVRQADDNEEARVAYRKALALDPNFARAYAGLAMTYAMDYRLRPSAGSAPALARAFELAETARVIDPEVPEAYWALGFVHAQSRRHQQAIESLQKAIKLNRSFADAYALMGGVYTYVGEPARSIPLLRTALRLNPEGGYLYFLLLGRAYLFENDIEQASINLREASARNPVDLETRVYLAAAAAAAGDRFGADWETAEIRALEPGFSTKAWLETYPLTSTAHRQRLTELLARAGL